MELKCNEISLNPQFLTANGLFPTYFELSSPEDICEQYENQGYLYLPQFLSTQKTNFLRQKYLSTFIGFKDNNVPYGTPGHPAYNFVRSQAFIDFTEQKLLYELARILLKSDVKLLKRRILRHFTKDIKKSSNAHIDFSYLDQGEEDLITAWIPMGDCSIETGGLMYLKNSHGIDFNKLKKHFPENKQKLWLTADLNKLSKVSQRQWLGQNYSSGDIVVHHPKNIHATLNCNTNSDRDSIDLRFTKHNSNSDPRWNDHWRADDTY